MVRPTEWKEGDGSGPEEVTKQLLYNEDVPITDITKVVASF